jgi:hypothetical protein
MTMFFDLDGVLRDLVSACNYDPQTWDEPCHGMTLIGYVNHNLDLLVSATPTEYLPVVVEKEITVLTCQPLNWIPYTKIWLSNHLPKATCIFCQHPMEKLDHLKNGDYLIEDYPLFPNNKQIIMIDRPYNRMVQAYKRIRTAGELKNVLNHNSAKASL